MKLNYTSYMQSSKLFAKAILLFFVGAAVLGLGMSMVTDAQGHMANCPLMNGFGSICQMNIFQHIANWQIFFAGMTPSSEILFLILFSLVAITAFASRIILEATEVFFPRVQYNIFSDPLRLAFARGILHSKIYNDSFISEALTAEPFFLPFIKIINSFSWNITNLSQLNQKIDFSQSLFSSRP